MPQLLPLASPVVSDITIEELEFAPDLRRFNHWFVLTLRPAQIDAGIGNTAGAVWTSDGVYTFWQLGASERGTVATTAFRDYEVELAINGNDLQNRPVSARAMAADFSVRSLADMLEGRGLAVARGEKVSAVFTNIDAASAIDPAIHLIGHRGLPPGWKKGAVLFADPNIRPFFEVIRSPTDAVIANAATLDVSHELDNCISACRLTCANRLDVAADPVDWDVDYELNSDRWTKGIAAGVGQRRASARTLCKHDSEGLDLCDLLGGPQLLQNGDDIVTTFLNDSGGNIQPRLIYAGHLGTPLGRHESASVRELALLKRIKALEARLPRAAAVAPTA